MAFKFVALLVTIAQICASLTEAACPCTREYRPLCGSDGVTYNNPCLLRCAASSSGKEIKIVKYEHCDEKNKCICTDDLSPVCATDGQTYDSECIMKCEGMKNKKSLKVKHRGPCVGRQKRDCLCAYIYSPVCGSDGKTYANKCALSCDMKTNPKLKYVRDGECNKWEGNL